MKTNLFSLSRWLAALYRQISPGKGRAIAHAVAVIASVAACALLSVAITMFLDRLDGEAAAVGPGMYLDLPDGNAAEIGSTIRVQVIAGPAPTTATSPACTDVSPAGGDGFCDLRGYRSKVELPPGLAWVPRTPPCEAELPPAPPGASLCTADIAGNPIHSVSSLTTPVLIAHGSVLVEVDVQCLAPGEYSLTLPTLASDPNGTVYFDFSGGFIPVKSASATAVVCSEGAGNIDPGGGTVDTGSGDLIEAQLDIAFAALSGPTSITIDSEPASSAPDLDPTFHGGTGPALIPEPANMPVLMAEVFDFGPDGLEFNNVASKLTFVYQDAALTTAYEEALGVLHYSDETGRWEPVPVAFRDVEANRIEVYIDSFSIYGIYQPVTQDTDSDGCRDVDELQTIKGSQLSGGRRDALFYWDFYDTPTGQYPLLSKDRSVSGQDFFSLLSRFGSTGSPGQNPVLAPLTPAPLYHPAFDRTGAHVPPDAGPWSTHQPDGAIAGTDFFAVLANFGHVCVST